MTTYVACPQSQPAYPSYVDPKEGERKWVTKKMINSKWKSLLASIIFFRLGNVGESFRQHVCGEESNGPTVADFTTYFLRLEFYPLTKNKTKNPTITTTKNLWTNSKCPSVTHFLPLLVLLSFSVINTVLDYFMWTEVLKSEGKVKYYSGQGRIAWSLGETDGQSRDLEFFLSYCIFWSAVSKLNHGELVWCR